VSGNDPGFDFDKISLSLNNIIYNVEKRYRCSGFSADFVQKSTIKSMQITDTASGTLYVKYPSMIRWEYSLPEKQIVIINAINLWIYRPEDKQVMFGKAPSYLGKIFFADVKSIRQNFDISLEKGGQDNYYLLKLVPKRGEFDISHIYIYVSRYRFEIFKVTIYNLYGDETATELKKLKFNIKLNDSMFVFRRPRGVDLLNIDK
jgi:outer membrane lipoprotein carrier protein